MSPSPPTPVPATTARELRDVASLRSWAKELLTGGGGMNKAVGRRVLDRLNNCPADFMTTTETRTEYRITSRTPNGLGRRLSCGSSLDRARERAAVLRAEGSTEVTVESRTVSTTRTESPWEEEQ